MFNLSIPEITDEELSKIYEQVKPIYTKDCTKYYIKDLDAEFLRTRSYIWDLKNNLTEQVNPDKLVVLDNSYFFCLHTFWHPSLFKPTIAEVLAQIDKNVLPSVAAFEMIENPVTVGDMYRNNFTATAFANGFRVSTVRLYRKK